MIDPRVVRGVVGVAGLLAVAEAAGRAGLMDTRIMPLASTVVARAAGLAADGEFLQDVSATLGVWAAGLVVAILLAVPVGVLLGSLPRVEAAVRPLIEFLRPIPSVALIPLVALIAASDARVKVTVIVYAACWPVLVNTMYGLHDVDPVAKDTLRAFGFGRLAVLLRVALPSAAPFVLTGVRLAASVALVVAVSAELLAGGAGGIGVYIIKAGSGYRVDLMVAAAVWAGLIGLAVNALLVRAERVLFRWHAARAGVAA
ncbi:ABC transporter permease [Microbispora sp. ATCC PTA-5024]|uniref:ABC transporter permease n=1 Tax=Microbispora sp. ATCC PTA-5024 TaxID=316330 RepID=UPI0003DD3498|nr:ABC transporter permease subunit [Microbispora sp. ATCC PTA-5024]ETK33953.1 ABC transporter permease [Microbispora sp. ATCC PTA-5024]